MGTNFYCKHIPTGAEYAEMQKALAEKQLDRLQELLNKARVKHHIGKRSAGLAFLFQGKMAPADLREQEQIPWDDNLDSLKEYLNKPDIQIEDEYGNQYTPEKFWKEIESCIYVKKGYWSDETYHQEHPQEYFYKVGNYEKVKDNIRWSYLNFS